MALTIDLCESEEAFLRMGDAWRDLFARCPRATVFASYEWARAAYLMRRFAANPFIVRVYEGERLVGLAPLCVRPDVGGTSKLEHMASSGGRADYLDLLCAPGREDSVYDAVFRLLADERSRWQVFDWPGLHASVATGRVLHSAQRAGLLALEEAGDVCTTLPLARSFEEYLQGLSGSLRKNLGRKRRKLERDTDARFARVEDEVTLGEGIDALQRLQDQRWDAAASAGRARYFDFIRVLAPSLLSRGWLDFHLVRAEEGIIAAELALVVNGTCSLFLTGCDVGERWRHHSLGTLTMVEAIRGAIARGCATADLMRGAEAYKASFGGVRWRSGRIAFFSSMVALSYYRAKWWARDLQRRYARAREPSQPAQQDLV